MGKLYEELKRRKVFRVAAAYAVVAWVLIQVSGEVLPTFEAPPWVNQTIIFLFILGFIPTLIAAWAYEITPEGVKPDLVAPSAPTTTTSTDRKLIYATFGLVLLVAGFQLSDRLLSDNGISSNRLASAVSVTPNTAVMRSSIILDQSLAPRADAGGSRTLLNIAPDGSLLAYANIIQGYWMLRNLATQETRVLENTVNGKAVFSPDSQKLLLVSNNPGPRTTSVLPVQGGLFQPLPIEDTLSATWLSDEDVIYHHSNGDTRILSLVDGKEDIIPGLDTASHSYVFNPLPSGSAFLYTQNPSTGPTGQLNNSVIQAFDLESRGQVLITNDGYHAQYVNSGHVLFLREGNLWAVPFDTDGLRVTGAEAMVLEGIDSRRSSAWGAYSVSDSGTLVYLPGIELVRGRTFLYWTDRLGNREEVSLPAGYYTDLRLSPNEELLALASFQDDGSSDIWVYNFASGTFTPITFSGNARNPVWTPDGSQLIFQETSARRGENARGELWIMNANGTGQAERILNGEAKPASFSPIDGKLIYLTGEQSAADINTLTLSDDVWVGAPLLDNSPNTFGARISPDGRWIAYISDESGIGQTYVQSYPNLEGGKWQISTETVASFEPSWGPNGDELFFLLFDGTLMHTKLSIEEDSFSFGAPEPLISGLTVQDIWATSNYAVSNNGDRFLHFYSQSVEERVASFDQDFAELVVISNFFEELRRLAPPSPQ